MSLRFTRPWPGSATRAMNQPLPLRSPPMVLRLIADQYSLVGWKRISWVSIAEIASQAEPTYRTFQYQILGRAFIGVGDCNPYGGIWLALQASPQTIRNSSASANMNGVDAVSKCNHRCVRAEEAVAFRLSPTDRMARESKKRQAFGTKYRTTLQLFRPRARSPNLKQRAPRSPGVCSRSSIGEEIDRPANEAGGHVPIDCWRPQAAEPTSSCLDRLHSLLHKPPRVAPIVDPRRPCVLSLPAPRHEEIIATDHSRMNGDPTMIGHGRWPGCHTKAPRKTMST